MSAELVEARLTLNWALRANPTDFRRYVVEVLGLLITHLENEEQQP